MRLAQILRERFPRSGRDSMNIRTTFSLAIVATATAASAQFHEGVLTGLWTDRTPGTNTMTTSFQAGANFSINGNTYTITRLDSFLIVGDDLTAGAALNNGHFGLGTRLNSLNGQAATWSQANPFKFTDVTSSTWDPVRNPGGGNIVERAGWDAKGSNRIDVPMTGGGSVEWSIATLRSEHVNDFFAYHVVFDRAFENTNGNTAFVRGLPSSGLSEPVPEPGTLAALGLGAAALMRRRKR